MLNIVRRAFEEPTDGSTDPLSVFPNPGPMYLLINALAITAITYMASFRLLNVTRAARAYDLRVPAIHASPLASGSSACGRSTKVIKLVVIFITLLFSGLFLGSALTIEKPASRIIFSTLLRISWTGLSFVGFGVLYLLSRPPSAEASFFRLPVQGHAVPLIARPKSARSFRDRLTIVTLIATAVYTAIYPNIWLTGFAAMGLGLGRISRPQGLAHTLSIRGVMLFAALYVTVFVVAVAFAVSSPSSSQSDVEDDKYKNVDFDAIMNPAWNNLALQYVGFIVGGLLTALVLRYEHSISDPTFDVPTTGSEELAPLTQAEGGVPAVSLSTKEAVDARVPVPQDRPRFAKPLFHVLLTALFAIHVPSILLSGMLACKSHHLDSTTANPVLLSTAKMIVLMPSQFWTILVHPFIVGVACLVRKDGGALWRYHEVVVKPLAPAPAAASTAEETAQVPKEPEEKVEFQDSEAFISKEIPYEG